MIGQTLQSAASASGLRQEAFKTRPSNIKRPLGAGCAVQSASALMSGPVLLSQGNVAARIGGLGGGYGTIA
jgi:hypothetical protein